MKHPTGQMVLALEYAFLTLTVENPWMLALLALIALFWWGRRAAGRQWLVLPLVLLLSTWSVMLSQGFFYQGVPRTPWLVLLSGDVFPLGDPPGLVLYWEGLMHGLITSLRFDVMLLLGAGLTARHALDELTGALRALKLPPTLSFLFSMAFRFLPQTWADFRAIWAAQRMRGWNPWRGGALRVILLPLFAGLTRRADEIGAALQSRGFSTQEFQEHPPTPLNRSQRWVCQGGLVLVVLLVAARLLGRLQESGRISWEWMEPVARIMGDYV